jgi:hypothetical protein
VGLYLLETATGTTERADVDALIGRLLPVVTTAGGELIETRVTADLKRLFAVIEHPSADGTALRDAFTSADVVVEDVAAVRLVGAELDEVKASAARPRYLVEWDLPAELTMDGYLARKREKAPLYDRIPEVAFRRTYVREDLDKCLCLYDAPCADDVYRARDVVSAPVDRFHELS